jgi:Nif-specific regulatory protein
LFNNDQAEWKIMKMKKMDGPVVSSLASLMNAYERALIIDALVSAQGNQSQAAKLLGTSKRVIHYKIHKYGIDPRRFRMGI